MASGRALYCLKNPLSLGASWLIKWTRLCSNEPWLGLLLRLITCFAPRTLDLKYWPLLAQKLQELGAAVGVLGGGPGASLPGDETAKEAGQCCSGAEPPFIRWRREMDLSIFGFALDPERARPDAWRCPPRLCLLSAQQRVGRCK